MTQEIFYRKVGRRYVPAQIYDEHVMHSFPQGTHLFVVDKGWHARRYDIRPNHAAILASALITENYLAQAIQKATELRPEKEPLTEEQRNAWSVLADSLGQEKIMLYWPSARCAAQDVVNRLMEDMDRTLQNPVVRQAYDEFLMLAKLTLEENQK